jgi:hypothetical protein
MNKLRLVPPPRQRDTALWVELLVFSVLIATVLYLCFEAIRRLMP